MFNFKELFAGIVLVFLLGVVGFLYRLSVDNSYKTVSVCSFDTKVCSDGSTVKRIGPACGFEPCAPISIKTTVSDSNSPKIATSTINNTSINKDNSSTTPN